MLRRKRRQVTRLMAHTTGAHAGRRGLSPGQRQQSRQSNTSWQGSHCASRANPRRVCSHQVHCASGGRQCDSAKAWSWLIVSTSFLHVIGPTSTFTNRRTTQHSAEVDPTLPTANGIAEIRTRRPWKHPPTLTCSSSNWLPSRQWTETAKETGIASAGTTDTPTHIGLVRPALEPARLAPTTGILRPGSTATALAAPHRLDVASPPQTHIHLAVVPRAPEAARRLSGGGRAVRAATTTGELGHARRPAVPSLHAATTLETIAQGRLAGMATTRTRARHGRARGLHCR
jgi:hypothetical protein